MGRGRLLKQAASDPRLSKKGEPGGDGGQRKGLLTDEVGEQALESTRHGWWLVDSLVDWHMGLGWWTVELRLHSGG